MVAQAPRGVTRGTGRVDRQDLVDRRAPETPVTEITGNHLSAARLVELEDDLSGFHPSPLPEALPTIGIIPSRRRVDNGTRPRNPVRKSALASAFLVLLSLAPVRIHC
jgi:hypothetical protein